MVAISRRALLVGGGALVVVPPLGIAGRAVATAPEASIVRGIRDRLPGLQVSDEDMLLFATEFTKRNEPFSGRSFDAAMVVLDNPWMESLLTQSMRIKFDWFVRGMMTDFLFSTDLFTSANGEVSAAQYVQYADPYQLGCRNPLARFDFEDGSEA